MQGDVVVRPPEVERALLGGSTAIRFAHAVLGLVTVVRQRARYRRPGLAGAVATAALVEVAWTSHSDLSHPGRTGPSTVAPAVVGVAACVGVACSVDPQSQFGDLVDWAFHLMLWTSARTALSVDAPRPGAVIGVSMATYVGVVRGRAGQESLSRAMANSLQIGAFFIAARLLATNLRSTDREIGVLNDQALRVGAAAATERERAAATAGLHAGALEALHRIEDLWPLDRRAAGRVAGAEALRLRQSVHGHDGNAPDLRSGLEGQTLALARQGLDVDLSLDVTESVSGATGDAVLTAVEACLLELSGAGDHHPRCTVRVVNDELGLTVRIRDHVTELDSSDLVCSLRDALTPVKGRAEVWSAPGRGTRIVMRVEP